VSTVLDIVPVAGPIDARVRPPGSKSYTNRALPLAALAVGTSTIEGALVSDDTAWMIAALGQLGVSIVHEDQRFLVTGVGPRWQSSSSPLWVGNAGTCARFLAPLVALGDHELVIDGDAAMRQRPMADLITALNDLGGDVRAMERLGAVPMRIRGRGVRGGRVIVRGNVSSQHISGLLLSAPYFEDGLTLEVDGHVVSRPYVDITMAVMKSFGVDVRNDGNTFVVAPGGYRPTTFAVEPDASAASYLFAAAAITGGRMVVEGLGSDSLQGDLQFVRILERMGCVVTMTATTTTVVGTSSLRGVDVDMSQMSDVAQTLAVVAVFATEKTTVRGIGFIRGKETDRIAAVVVELRRVGIVADEHDDGFTIHPGMPQPATVNTYHDHRMAMSFALLGLRAPGIVINDPACVAKTFPSYWDVLASLPRGY
jgi:3-phosphoshikimate 1-carboxyvinyltransferase